jgi:isoleucyl-tRNA synthetase
VQGASCATDHQTEQSQRLGYWMDWNDPDILRWLADRLMEDPSQVVTMKGPGRPVTGTVEGIVGRLGMPELGGSYFTFSDENNYMIWTFLKKCWEKGWLYHGVDVMPWCPRCATGLSQHEIVTDGYAELTHETVVVKLPLRIDGGGSGAAYPPEAAQYLLVWTTTPWTLTSNVAAAVGPDLIYLQVQQEEEVLYLSKGALHMLKGPYTVLRELKGIEMEGWRYTGRSMTSPAHRSRAPHHSLKAARSNQDPQQAGRKELKESESASAAHRVILWEMVGEVEGTGIVHIAPGCGAEDFALGKEYGLPLVAPLDEEGRFVDGFGWLSGMPVAEVAKPIFFDLERKRLLYRIDSYTHRYPVCWRCQTELVFRLVDEWFISMGPVYERPREELAPEEKARSLRYQIMDVVDRTAWVPTLATPAKWTGFATCTIG